MHFLFCSFFTFKHSAKKLKSLEYSSNLRIAEINVDFDCSGNLFLWNFPLIFMKMRLWEYSKDLCTL